ncbi:YqcI/YcgG family protein [Bacillus manliponensis]|uniref:YqcI/YcgG family protein n=1 Tax=Bacillus manliponensis TaxID=574376 RepID=A0A073K215_9BACI|nr:YqcI/YcgG family protein [Bacillus manliponensis]KEK20601.1 YqcI/YcgG family protein [Bacillus manliponensis]
MKQSYLLDNTDMKIREDIPSWVGEEFHTFSSVVLDKEFPCYFGLTALKKNELRYSFLAHNDWEHLPETMLAFLRLMEEDTSVRRGFFLFVEPEKEICSLEYYRAYFWRILQYLHEKDERPWPNHIPENPDHHLWEFSFGGEAMFAFANAPAYKQRRTRNLGDSMVVGFQPRIIFDGLEGDRPKGAYSRQMVRERVEKWDQLPKHPNISHYGDPNHREWKQYFIGDDCEPSAGKCPFYHKIEK